MVSLFSTVCLLWHFHNSKNELAVKIFYDWKFLSVCQVYQLSWTTPVCGGTPRSERRSGWPLRYPFISTFSFLRVSLSVVKEEKEKKNPNPTDWLLWLIGVGVSSWNVPQMYELQMVSLPCPHTLHEVYVEMWRARNKDYKPRSRCICGVKDFSSRKDSIWNFTFGEGDRFICLAISSSVRERERTFSLTACCEIRYIIMSQFYIITPTIYLVLLLFYLSEKYSYLFKGCIFLIFIILQHCR